MIIHDISVSSLGIQIVTETEIVPKGFYEPGCTMWDFLLYTSKKIVCPEIKGKKLVFVSVITDYTQWAFQ